MDRPVKNIWLLQIAGLLLFCLNVQLSFAQDTSPQDSLRSALAQYNIDTSFSDRPLNRPFTIRNIVLTGNKRTRSVIILRELTFREGDSIHIAEFPSKFSEAQNRLMNTTLFHEVKIAVSKFDGYDVDVQVWVDERWYILPMPHLKPIDRNFSQWLFKEKASLKRVDYGIKLMMDNFTGNNDKLRFYFITGYTKQLMLSYHRPFIDKSMKWGMNFDLSIGKTHELNYNITDNKQDFLELKDKSFARNFFKGKIEATYRPAFYTTHAFGMGYNYFRVNDSVIKLNPNFFAVPGNKIAYPELYYKLIYRNLDYNPYPTKGQALEFVFSRQGFGKDVNVTQLIAKGIKYWPINEKTFYSVGAAGTIKAPFKQPYYSSQLLGYGDTYMRGYEYYVIDGVAGGLVNATFAHRLANFKIHIPGTKWFTPRLIPLKIYGKTFGNAGYAYQKEPYAQTLNNKLLFGGGIGIDIVTMYDFNLKIEWSFNQLGENGIYLQKKSTFQ